jgi:hypothetical protein
MERHGYQTYGSREHTDIHCSINARKYVYLEMIAVEIFALNMNSRIDCHREDRENLKPANISTHTVIKCWLGQTAGRTDGQADSSIPPLQLCCAGV